MARLFDNDDYDERPPELVWEARQARLRRGGWCSECHSSGGHLPRCPEGPDEDLTGIPTS